MKWNKQQEQHNTRENVIIIHCHYYVVLCQSQARLFIARWVVPCRNLPGSELVVVVVCVFSAERLQSEIISSYFPSLI